MGPSCRAQAQPSPDSGPDNKHSACLLFSSLHLSFSLSVSFTRIVPLFGNYAARFNYDNSSERRSAATTATAKGNFKRKRARMQPCGFYS